MAAATGIDWRLEVLTLLWDRPEGRAIGAVLGYFGHGAADDVTDALIDLEERMKIHRVGRNALDEDGNHTVETRLVAWRGFA